VTAWLIALAVLAAGLTWALNRELERLERERRLREWLATSAAARRFRANLDEFSRQIGMSLLPAMQRFAQAVHDAQPGLAAFAAAWTKLPAPAEPVTEAQGGAE
jgi:hypothetical protein